MPRTAYNGVITFFFNDARTYLYPDIEPFAYNETWDDMMRYLDFAELFCRPGRWTGKCDPKDPDMIMWFEKRKQSKRLTEWKNLVVNWLPKSIHLIHSHWFLHTFAFLLLIHCLFKILLCFFMVSDTVVHFSLWNRVTEDKTFLKNATAIYIRSNWLINSMKQHESINFKVLEPSSAILFTSNQHKSHCNGKEEDIIEVRKKKLSISMAVNNFFCFGYISNTDFLNGLVFTVLRYY